MVRILNRLTSIDILLPEFEKVGYSIDVGTYKGLYKKATITCPYGHKYEIQPRTFLSGSRCKKCLGFRHLTKNEVHIIENKSGIRGLSYDMTKDEFINPNKYQKFKCSFGHIFGSSLSKIHNGKQCPFCLKKEKKLYRIKSVINTLENDGYLVLTKPENVTDDRIRFVCPSGHENVILLSNAKIGHRCSMCYGNKRKTKDDILEMLSGAGLVPIDNIGNKCSTSSVISCICANGHIRRTTVSNLVRFGCKHCISNYDSRREKEIFDFVSSICSDAISNDRRVIRPKELDIYVPDKRFAIEYCGLYWHSEEAGKKDKLYHRKKYSLCKDKGIKLLTIFEDEYINKKEIVLNTILEHLGVVSDTIDSGNLVFGSVGLDESVMFFDKNSINSRPSLPFVSFGLFSQKKEILQVISFFRKEGRCNLVSFDICTALGVSILNGEEKLITTSIHHLRALGVKKIQFVQDLRYPLELSGVFNNIGFKIVDEVKCLPYFVYSLNRSRKIEDMPSKSCSKLWDCGSITYGLNI